MAGKRSYHDSCSAAHALDLVGERWALLVVRELILGPKRYTDLKVGLLEPTIQAIGRWGARSPLHSKTEPIGYDGLILSLRTMFSPAAAADFRADLTLQLGETTYVARVAGGELALHRGG